MATNGFKVKIGNKWFIVVCLRCHQNLKPAAHGEERAEQTVLRGGLRMRGTFGEKFTSRGREEKIKHVWCFSPREASSSLYAAIVRIELSLVNQASNKNTLHSHVTSVMSHFVPPTLSWIAGFTWVCNVFLLDAWLNQAQLDSPDGRTQREICLAWPKISNMFDFILTASRGEFLTTISPYTRGKTAEFAQLFPQVFGGLKTCAFALLCCGVRQRNARKFALYVQHDFFLHFC